MTVCLHITYSSEILWQTKTITIYLHYHRVYGHRIWQDGDIPWEATNHNVILRFDHVVLQGHMTNEN